MRAVIAGCLFLAACTLAQTSAVFTDIEVACEAEALATSVIPTGTPAATVAADIEVACNLVDSQLPDIIKVVTAFEAQQASVGSAPPAGVLYTPSPMVKGKALR